MIRATSTVCALMLSVTPIAANEKPQDGVDPVVFHTSFECVAAADGYGTQCRSISLDGADQCKGAVSIHSSNSLFCQVAGSPCPTAPLETAVSKEAADACDRQVCRPKDCSLEGGSCGGSLKEIDVFVTEEDENAWCNKTFPGKPKLCVAISLGTCSCDCEL